MEKGEELRGVFTLVKVIELVTKQFMSFRVLCIFVGFFATFYPKLSYILETIFKELNRGTIKLIK